MDKFKELRAAIENQLNAETSLLEFYSNAYVMNNCKEAEQKMMTHHGKCKALKDVLWYASLLSMSEE